MLNRRDSRQPIWFQSDHTQCLQHSIVKAAIQTVPVLYSYSFFPQSMERHETDKHYTSSNEAMI